MSGVSILIIRTVTKKKKEKTMLRAPLKLACAFTVLMTIASAASADPLLGVNLLSNPGFESSNGNGAWNGLYNQQSTSPTVSTVGGTYYWSAGGVSGDTVLVQFIDLTDLGFDEMRISTGGYYIQYGGLQNSRNNALGMIALTQQGGEYISGEGYEIESYHELDSIAGDGTVNGWEWSVGSMRMLSGVDTLIYQFYAYRNGSSTNTAYLDNAYVQLQEYTVWSGKWSNAEKTLSTNGLYGTANINPIFSEDYLTLGYSGADYGEFLGLSGIPATCNDAKLNLNSDLIIRDGCQFVCNDYMELRGSSDIDVKDSSLETKRFAAYGSGGNVILDNSTWTSTGTLLFHLGSIHLTNGSIMTTEGYAEFGNGSSPSLYNHTYLTIDAGCEFHCQGETNMAVYARNVFVTVDGLLHNSGERLRLASPYYSVQVELDVNDGGEWISDSPVQFIWGKVSINDGGKWTSNDEVTVGNVSYKPADDVITYLDVDGGTWTANGPVTLGNTSGNNFAVQLTVSNEGTVAFYDEVDCDTRTHFVLDSASINAYAGLELTGSDNEDDACTITGLWRIQHARQHLDDGQKHENRGKREQTQ